jgi:hypothetical protein
VCLLILAFSQRIRPCTTRGECHMLSGEAIYPGPTLVLPKFTRPRPPSCIIHPIRRIGRLYESIWLGAYGRIIRKSSVYFYASRQASLYRINSRNQVI